MTALTTSARLLMALLGIGALAACDTLGDFGPRETVAVADEGFADGYPIGDTPVSSMHPVRGLDDDYN